MFEKPFKMLNNGVFVFEISSLVTEIFKFLFLKLMTNRLITKINHKIKNISGNIGVMLLKLGTSNVPRLRNKIMPTVPFSWQQFFSGLFHARLTFSFFVFIRNRLLPMSWLEDMGQYGQFVRFK